jgi:5-methylcytosine-specific restriction endonuclease McrA
MRALVAELERQKYAVTPRPRSRAGQSAGGVAPQAARALETHETPESESGHTRRRGRHVPAAIRRAVYARDGARCTYTSYSGQRCRETQRLELHHCKAFARGGAHSHENLTLRCPAHNDLAAEQDFGKGFIERARDSTQHEPWVAHDAGRPPR